MPSLRFYCDEMRHLVCVPYSTSNLHWMARFLNIKRCWFHASKNHHHYDIPKRRIKEIEAHCNFVSARLILRIIKGEFNNRLLVNSVKGNH